MTFMSLTNVQQSKHFAWASPRTSVNGGNIGGSWIAFSSNETSDYRVIPFVKMIMGRVIISMTLKDFGVLGNVDSRNFASICTSGEKL